MNLARIAIRLTEAAARARRPFRIVLRIAAAEASSAVRALFASSALRWRKLSTRRSGCILVEHRHTNLSLHLYQRVDMHFTCGLAMLARQSFVPVASVPTAPAPALRNALVPRGGAMVADGDGFRSGAEATGPFGKRDVAAFPSSLRVSTRDHRSTAKPAAASASAAAQRQIDRLGSISLRKRPWAWTTPWPQRAMILMRSGSRQSPSLRHVIVKAGPEQVPVMGKVLPKPTSANGVELGAGPASLTPASRERNAPPTQPRRVPPLKLVWREPASGDDTQAQAASVDQRDLTFGEQVAGSATASRSAHSDEKVIAEAREAARHEMLSGPAVDRLAEDVMRRLEKRMRIERERRGT